MGPDQEKQIIQRIKLKLSLENIKSFRDRFNIPVTDKEIEDLPYVRPPKNSPEIQYLHKTRKALEVQFLEEE